MKFNFYTYKHNYIFIKYKKFQDIYIFNFFALIKIECFSLFISTFSIGIKKFFFSLQSNS